MTKKEMRLIEDKLAESLMLINSVPEKTEEYFKSEDYDDLDFHVTNLLVDAIRLISCGTLEVVASDD